MSKLTSYDRVTIRELYDSGNYTQQELAEIYGVGRSTIQRVLNEPDFEPKTTYGHYVGTDTETFAHPSEPVGIPAHSDDSSWKLGLGLLGLAMGSAAFVVWVIAHAI